MIKRKIIMKVWAAVRLTAFCHCSRWGTGCNVLWVNLGTTDLAADGALCKLLFRFLTVYAAQRYCATLSAFSKMSPIFRHSSVSALAASFQGFSPVWRCGIPQY
jgi:hypothetical protein